MKQTFQSALHLFVQLSTILSHYRLHKIRGPAGLNLIFSVFVDHLGRSFQRMILPAFEEFPRLQLPDIECFFGGGRAES